MICPKKGQVCLHFQVVKCYVSSFPYKLTTSIKDLSLTAWEETSPMYW